MAMIRTNDDSPAVITIRATSIERKVIFFINSTKMIISIEFNHFEKKLTNFISFFKVDSPFPIDVVLVYQHIYLFICLLNSTDKKKEIKEKIFRIVSRRIRIIDRKKPEIVFFSLPFHRT